MSMSDDALRKQANALYWDSEKSVNHIAEEMDLSKGALYELIAPLPSESTCPECSAMTHFPNRTAREKSKVTCPECDFQGPPGPPPSETAPSKPRLSLTTNDDPSVEIEYAGPGADSRIGTRVWVGAACLGVAVGLYFMTRRRR